MGTGLESTIFSTAEIGLTEQGLVPRAIIEIFQKQSQSSSSIFASFIEIYNEKIKDLLIGPSHSSASVPEASLVIREDTNGDIYLAGCHEEQVAVPADLFKYA